MEPGSNVTTREQVELVPTADGQKALKDYQRWLKLVEQVEEGCVRRPILTYGVRGMIAGSLAPHMPIGRWLNKQAFGRSSSLYTFVVFEL